MKALLTIDWDYFMPYVGYFNLSYLENRRNIDKHWYKLYLEKKQCGIDITKEMVVGKEKDNFWTNISKYFNFSSIDKIIVSDSHKIAYDLAKVTKCEEVYNFDSHTDLGYGGLESLNYEVNCANWLGKLLNEGWVRRGNIILSPYTSEKEEYFKEINESFDILYKEIDELEPQVQVNTLHVCRSGAWTAPWLDNEFREFIKGINKKIEYKEYMDREWNINNITLADQIEYLLFS